MAESWEKRVTAAADKIFPSLTYSKPHVEMDFMKLGSSISILHIIAFFRALVN